MFVFIKAVFYDLVYNHKTITHKHITLKYTYKFCLKVIPLLSRTCGGLNLYTLAKLKLKLLHQYKTGCLFKSLNLSELYLCTTGMSAYGSRTYV